MLQTLAATHLLGAVLNICVPVLSGERLARAGRLTSLQARLISRVWVAASPWSPLFIALAALLDFVPHAQPGIVAGVGLLTAFALMFCCARS